MDPVLTRVVTFVVGLSLLFLILRSMVRVALMNQHYRDVFAQLIGSVMHRLIAARVTDGRDYEATQRTVLWCFPVYFLFLIAVYFVGAMTGFALLYWATQAVPTWHEAFIASGSALNTLGFATPSTRAGQWLAIPEGALGLGIVVFLFTFLPGYQTVIMAREDRTAWLYARVGGRPTGVGLLEWCQRAGGVGGVWEAWESWFRTLADTHAVSPMLSFAPSVQRGQSWVVAAAAVLDATSVAISTLETPNAEAAKVCAWTGARALRAVADALGWDGTDGGAGGASVSWEAYNAACARLAAAGVPLNADREASWREFVALRSRYEESLAFVARQTFVLLDRTLVAG